MKGEWHKKKSSDWMEQVESKENFRKFINNEHSWKIVIALFAVGFVLPPLWLVTALWRSAEDERTHKFYSYSMLAFSLWAGAIFIVIWVGMIVVAQVFNVNFLMERLIPGAYGIFPNVGEFICMIYSIPFILVIAWDIVLRFDLVYIVKQKIKKRITESRRQ